MQLSAKPDLTFTSCLTDHRRGVAYKLAMSGVEETSNDSVEVKENKEFDVEAEDHLGDDYVVDPTRYIFYR